MKMLLCPVCDLEIQRHEHRCKYNSVYMHLECAFNYFYLKIQKEKEKTTDQEADVNDHKEQRTGEEAV